MMDRIIKTLLIVGFLFLTPIVFAQPSLDVERDSTGSGLVITLRGKIGAKYQLESTQDFTVFKSIGIFELTNSPFKYPFLPSQEATFFRLKEVIEPEPTPEPEPVDPSSGFNVPALPSITFVDVPEGSFVMGNDAAMGPIASEFKPERSVNMSGFGMSEAEITTEQYVSFLNAALADGLIEVTTTAVGPPGIFVVGSAQSTYQNHKLIDLSGSRVLKDHDKNGTIDPENPLNQCWVEYDAGTQSFSVKDSRSIDWDAYVFELDESRSDWEELADNALPTLDEVAQWPVTFIKWYGAHAFATCYGVSLPTEAQWEFAAQGGEAFKFPAGDGTVDASKANYNEENHHPDGGHVVAQMFFCKNEN
jgi:formylglycine-generating enzyme required for sulfatase activity